MNSYKKKVLEARKKILELTNEQLKQIDEIYAKSATRLIDEILELPDISRTRVHDIDIARLLNEYTKDLYKQLYPNITENMMESSIIQRQVILDYVDQVAKDRTLSEIIKNNINIYSNKVVKTLIAGEYYKGGKTLSKRLWNLTQENGAKIDEFIKMNIASGANARKLANDLETLINPKKRLATNNFKAGFDSYKVSYQAQRLARTSITHAAAETQIQNAKKNPFDKGLKWNLSASHGARMHGKQDECDDREGKVYKPNETPLQHPNCMCYFTEEVTDIDDAIARINKWVDGGEDKELDKWCEGFDRTKKEETKPSKQPVKVNGKDGTINIKIPKTNNKKADTNVGKSDIINRKAVFNPAHTIAEAEKFAKETLGIVNSNYKGCDITTANEWNRGLFDSFNRFPALKNNFGFAGECHERNKQLRPVLKEYFFNKAKSINSKTDIKILDEIAEKQTKTFMRRMAVSKNTYAQSWSPTQKEFKGLIGVTVNKDYGKNSKIFIEALSKDVKNKYHPIGCDSIRSVLDHEIGHQLDSLLNVSNQKNIQELFKSKSKKQLTKEISEYSWNNDNSNKYGEFIAEGWAEYCNNPNPRHIAKEIGETIERLYKEWEKKNL